MSMPGTARDALSLLIPFILTRALETRCYSARGTDEGAEDWEFK